MAHCIKERAFKHGKGCCIPGSVELFIECCHIVQVRVNILGSAFSFDIGYCCHSDNIRFTVTSILLIALKNKWCSSVAFVLQDGPFPDIV